MRLVIVFDGHRHHVEEDEDKNGDLESSGVAQVIEHRQELIQRSMDHFLWLLPAQLLHGRVVMFLGFSQEHFQHTTLVLQQEILLINFLDWTQFIFLPTVQS